MTAEADRSWQNAEATKFRERLRRALIAIYVRGRRAGRWLLQRLPFGHGFSSLTRRIVVLNLIGLAILVSGILYLNQFRAGLIDAKVQRLTSHSSDDDQRRYRTEEALETDRRSDCLVTYARRLAELGVLTSRAEAAMRAELVAELDLATAEAEAAADADPATILLHVLGDA